ncbi:DUF397 domain-containing protein [Actinocorallia populi]|uniref:DUF397 domain-containing protein n=1 Tax=Actinocorallia populi TaxID=2079200 RepID=UPI000D094BAE|nr:DUF397 domain-containing protein [Actinocorallia populi]
MESLVLKWRKSSYTTANGGDCVELATLAGAVLVRDSKNPAGARLRFTPRGFRRLVKGVKGS